MTFSKVDLLENCISIRWFMASLNSWAKKKNAWFHLFELSEKKSQSSRF